MNIHNATWYSYVISFHHIYYYIFYISLISLHFLFFSYCMILIYVLSFLFDYHFTRYLYESSYFLISYSFIFLLIYFTSFFHNYNTSFQSLRNFGILNIHGPFVSKVWLIEFIWAFVSFAPLGISFLYSIIYQYFYEVHHPIHSHYHYISSSYCLMSHSPLLLLNILFFHLLICNYWYVLQYVFLIIDNSYWAITFVF